MLQLASENETIGSSPGTHMHPEYLEKFDGLDFSFSTYHNCKSKIYPLPLPIQG
jgi:hypothetical protein